MSSRDFVRLMHGGTECGKGTDTVVELERSGVAFRGNMAASNLFSEDVVCRINRQGNVDVGIVVFGGSGSMDSEDSDFDEEFNRLKSGQVLVAWHHNNKEQAASEHKIVLADRSLMMGDVVRLNSEPQGQKGYCLNIEVKCAVQVVGTDCVIPEVSTKKLKPLLDIQENVTVCYESWVGIVKDVQYQILVQFKDGSRCYITDEDAEGFDDITGPVRKELGLEYYNNFYPGQRLSGKMKYFQHATWVVCNNEVKQWRRKPLREVVIIIVEVGIKAVDVHWLMKIKADPSSEKNSPPKETVSGAQINCLQIQNIFSPLYHQVGDKSKYTIQESDSLLIKAQWQEALLDYLRNKTLPCSDGQTVKGQGSRRKKKMAKEAEDDGELGDALPLCDGRLDGKEKAEEPGDAGDSSDEYEDIENEGEFGGGKTIGFLTKLPGERGRAGSRKRRAKNSTPRGIYLSRQKHPSDSKSPRKPAVRPGEEVIVDTLLTYSIIDVMWQDGTISRGIPSRDLFPVLNLNEMEYFPGDFVLPANECMLHHPRYGVIQKVQHEDLIAVVKWFRIKHYADRATCEFEKEEECGVYELREHSDYEQMRPGTVVVHLSNMFGSVTSLMDLSKATEDSKNQEPVTGQVLLVGTDGKLRVRWLNGTESLCHPFELFWINPEDEEMMNGSPSSSSSEVGSIEDVVDDADEGGSSIESWTTASEDSFHLRSKTAIPVDIWQQLGVATDMISSALNAEVVEEALSVSNIPEVFTRVFKIFRLDPEDVEETLAELRMSTESALSTESSSVMRDILEGFSLFMNCLSGNLLEELKNERNIPLSNEAISVAAAREILNSIQRTCSKMVHQTSESKDKEHESDDILLQSPLSSCDIPASANSSVHVNPNVGDDGKPEADMIIGSPANEGHPNSNEEPKEGFQEPMSPTWGLSFEESVPATHAFVSGKSIGETGATLPSSVMKTLQTKDLKLLRKNLPRGILVKTYEDRGNLFSAMVVGPESTPYEDCPFFFEIMIPSDYPNSPPLMHYQSFCSDRLNPNLYENGKVCVSLLGTWSGSGSEVWNPKVSNLLQVLLSIQGLILNAEPYYNEAGYEKYRGTDEASEDSRRYNEMVLTKVVQSMTNIIQNRPLPFQKEVMQHLERIFLRFLHRMESILNSDQGGVSLSFPLLPTSRGFRISLEKGLNQLKAVAADHNLLPSP